MSENPEYLDDPVPPIEPTFLTSVSFWTPPGRSVFSKVKMDLKRLLHGGQEYVFHGPPPRAGQELTVQTRVAEVYEKEGKRGGTMTFVVTVAEFRDDAGKLVAEMRSDRDRDRQAARRRRKVVMAPRWEDLDVGAGPEPRTVGPLNRTDFVRYQGASGDFNPIHHDEEFAQGGGVPVGVLGRHAAGWDPRHLT